MIRKWLILFSMVVMIVLIGVPVNAAEGTIRVKSDGQKVTLSYLGQPEATGFRLLEHYGGGYLTFDDTLSPELAAWFSQKADTEISGTGEKDGTVFRGLQEGLYLVQGIPGVFEPFMVTLPWDGFYWEVELDPMNSTSPQTGDTVGIAIFAMAASGAGVTVIGRRRKRC